MTSDNDDLNFEVTADSYYSDFGDGYIGKHYDHELESTKELCRFMEETVGEKDNLTILDAGCGDGNIINYLMKRFPGSRFTGFDIARAMVDYAQKKLPNVVKIEKGDLLNMDVYAQEKFDVVYTVHTLSLFPEFEPVIKQLINSTRSHLFINSLFDDHNVDMYTIVKEPNFPQIQWNIFSKERVKKYCIEQGAKKVIFRPFNMPFPLNEPKEGMGSYTKQLIDGTYITFSGPLFLPWYLVRVDFI